MSSTNAVSGRPFAQAGEGRSLWRTGVVAGSLAAAVNAMVFALAVAAGVFPSLTSQPDGGAGMSIEPVLLVSFAGVLAGVGAFALLRRRMANPVPTFLKIAAAALLLSFAAPFAIPGTALSQAIVMNGMHVVAALLVVWSVMRARPA